MKVKALFVSALVVMVSAAQVNAQSTRVTSVVVSGSSSDYTITVNGTGFGTLSANPPFSGDTSYFRIFEVAQLGAGEYGYTGDANALTYQSWSDTQIQVSGLVGQPGDGIQIWVSNPTTGAAATWGGNLPGGPAHPQITSVLFFGSDSNLEMQISGSGFGNAPVSMPFTGDLNQFIFQDQVAHSGPLAAGASYWGTRSPTAVTVRFRSWSDSQIICDGFAGAYGQGGATFQNGDPVYIVVWNSGATSQTGPQSAWGGFAVENESVLNVGKAVYLTATNLQVGFNYQVQTSADLITWTNQGSAFTASNSCWRSPNYWDVDNWGKLFFRLQLQPAIVGAQGLKTIGTGPVAPHEIALSLASGGQLYVYGMATGGSDSSSAFANGQTIQVTDADGYVSAELSAGTSSTNSYTTSTSNDTFGGFGVSGFSSAQGFYGVNPGPGPNLRASVQFSLSAPALVVAIGMGSSQATLTFSGLDNPTVDVYGQTIDGSHEPVLAIEHEYLRTGIYTIQVATGDGTAFIQDPNDEVDLLGVLIFSVQPNAASSSSPQIPLP